MDDALSHGSKKKSAKRRTKKTPTPAQRAKWKADKQARGSAEPAERRCGRKLSGTDPARYCMRWPSKGRDSCASHGGTAKRGADAPAFVHGQSSVLYADVLGGALLRGYEAIKTDDELLSCREQIRLWTGRERQLVEQLAAGGFVDDRAVQATMTKVDDVSKMPARTEEEQQKRGAALVAAWDEHRRAVHRLSDDEAAWRQLEAAGRMLVRFRREERRLMAEKHRQMSVDKVLYLMALLTAVAIKYITDPAQRARFAEDAKLLAAGHQVEVDEELLDALPFGRRR